MGGDLIFTFVLLNRGVPDLEALFCINRTKDTELLTEITRCVSVEERLSDLFSK